MAPPGPREVPDYFCQFRSDFDGTKSKKAPFGPNRLAQLGSPQILVPDTRMAPPGPREVPDYFCQFRSDFDGTKSKKSPFGPNRLAQLGLPQNFSPGHPYGPPQIHRRSRRTFVNLDRIRTGPKAKRLHSVQIGW